MIVKALNRLLSEKLGGMDYVAVDEYGEVIEDPPKGVPYVPVLRDNEKFFGNEVMGEVVRQL